MALAGVAAYVGGVAIAGAASSLAMAVAGLALVGFGSGAFSPGAAALASRQADDGNRGVVMGTYQAGVSLARALGPFEGERAGDVTGGVVHARSPAI